MRNRVGSFRVISRHMKFLALFTFWLGILFLCGFFHLNINFIQVWKGFTFYQGPCHPRTNIMFLKTHKTASSTVMNILFRFTEKLSLTVALPAGRKFHLGYPDSFEAEFVEEFKTMGPSYNIMCNHLRFNLKEVRKVMPVNTTYFSILRNPVSLLESSYVYYKAYAPAFKKSRDVNEYLASPGIYYNKSESGYNIYAKNNMWFDFGYDNNAEDDENYTQSVLRMIEQDFHLILIADYFDESMVLLKNFLCWDLDDVVYFKMNSRSPDTIQSLTPENKEKVKEWCSLDWKLYQHFNKTFWKRIQENIGLRNLYREVNLLRKKQKQLMEKCLLDPVPINETQIKDKLFKPFQSGDAHILGYNLKHDLDDETLRTCQKMITPELQYMSYLYALQYPDKKRKSINFPSWWS
ncbi:PREDICTED: galactose-3-O-sulfotransferase 2 [Gavialis gangeticus]|uniref:galactose-3-O-sulfotransferase 2 n=1 Tax=Gavialis gangeticus TaxID=94835 RepID=UPI00092F4A51|nr:PREDICTED: galactose-3-O-sulfotransferase 2 [Gavialis gangeticus]